MAADDDEMPFRWSLFLPADGDTPSMRATKYAVIGMGIVLILGFFIILARIVYLTSRMDASLPPTGELQLALPAGTEIKTMALDGHRLALHLAGPGAADRSIALYDIATGRVISRITLQQGEPGASAATGVAKPTPAGDHQSPPAVGPPSGQ